jgi:ribosomal protein L14E/L6E/L27E
MRRGCVVLCTAGRDKGRLMAVTACEPDGRVWTADGRRRRVEHAKCRNPRHVTATGCSVPEASMATNRELRRALAAMPAHTDIT